MKGETHVGRPFPKGVSGNPGGRPKGNPAVKALLKEHSVEAAEKLVELLTCGLEKVELAAAQEILNRTEGKPLESVRMDVSGHLDMRAQLRNIVKERMMTHGQPESDGGAGATEQAGTGEIS